MVGFDDRKFEIESWQDRKYSVSAMVRNIDDGLIWRLWSMVLLMKKVN